MPFSKHVIAVAMAGLLAVPGAQAGWLDKVVEKVQESAEKVAEKQNGSLSDLTVAEMDGGLREALNKGVKVAVSRLGREDGYFGDKLVRIPVPEKLQRLEKGLRKIRMEKYADDFILAMNRAAEKAVPETAKIFADAIKQMSIEDARKIIKGPDDAATDYFREKTRARLEAAILPIVKKYTRETGVTKYYKKMAGAYDTYGSSLAESSGINKFLGAAGIKTKKSEYDSNDLDGYITNKGVRGLFTVIAGEEKKIRDNPAERTTQLLKKVFGNS